VTQAGIWAEGPLHSDLWRIGAALLAVLFAVGMLSQGGDEAERIEGGATGFTFGLVAALLIALVTVVPGRRMPDWAIGLRGSAPPQPALQAPLVLLGWALTALATVAALAIDGPLQALYALAITIVAPLGLGHSIHRFVERASRTRAWAAARGLEWRPEGELPERTPLLREGDWRYATNLVAGPILGEVDATVAHLACVEVEEGSDGGSETTKRFTVLVAPVADPGDRLPLCICAPRSRIPGYDALDALLKKLRRIELVSAEFERRFDLRIDRKGDEVWLRRLFEPTFIERMTMLDRGRLGWELERGTLAVYSAGYVSDPAELDRLVDLAGLVGERIRAEVAETDPVSR